MTFYVLVATAVYDQGVVGVYATEQLARDAAESIYLKTDGHHGFRIDVVELDRTYKKVFPYSFMPGMDEDQIAKRRRERPVNIELNPKGAPDV